MMGQSFDSKGNDMRSLYFPKGFPEKAVMLEMLRKTFEESWKIDLNVDDANRWLENFTGRYFSKTTEQRLALWLLCNFTYYNVEEVNYLCAVLFKKFLHCLMSGYNFSTPEEADELIHRSCFTQIGDASESGGLILYHFRQEARIGLDRFYFPTSLPDKSNDIICVDDVMISGKTACKFFAKKANYFKGKRVYYLSIITTPKAIERLAALGVKSIYCTILDERNQAFSDNSLIFYRFPSLKEPTRLLVKGYGETIEPKYPLGFDEGQYCFGLHYNIPNNSLPVFWSSNNWYPFFERKVKYYHDKSADRKYPFFV